MKKAILMLAAAVMMTTAFTACSDYEDEPLAPPVTKDPSDGDGGKEPDENIGKPASDRFLYYGEDQIAPFIFQGDNTYTLSLEMDSSWGCLVRTSDTAWSAGTKYGAVAGKNNLEYGKPLALRASSASYDPSNILLPWMEPLMYHSHFWTPAFADIDYGAAASCENSPAFAAICNAAKKWIDMGVDGLRLDGAKHIYHDASSDENPTFWGKFYDELNGYHKSKGREGNFYLVGEVYDDYAAAAPYLKGLPSIFEFAFWYRLEWAFKQSAGCYFANDLKTYRDGYAAIRPDYIISTKLTNHDEDRVKSLLGGSEDKAKLAGAVLLTASGSPYIYYGEELGYVGIKNGKGDEYVRNPMKWGDNTTTTFIKQAESGMNAVKDASVQDGDESSILNVYRKFSQLRNTCPALAHGKMTPHPDFSGKSEYLPVAAWYMEAEGQKMMVVHNFTTKESKLTVNDNVTATAATLGDVTVTTAEGGKTELSMKGYSSWVALLDGGTAVGEWDGEKRADVSYQLLIYSFADSDGDGTGDFNGITAKLDYLDKLGVSALWLSPAHPASSYHGYDVLDYEALNEVYGTEADFQKLIDEAHRHGIKIYMDWVINHTSVAHPWFLDLLSSADSPYCDYYVTSKEPEQDIAAGRIPMIANEGKSGYDAGQWFQTVRNTGNDGARKLKFTLKWGTAPTLTVEETDAIDQQL